MNKLLRRWEAHLGALRLPPRPICVALVFVFLAFGTILGRVTRIQAANASETAPPAIVVQEPAAMPAASSTRAIPEASSAFSKEEEEGETQLASGSESASSSGNSQVPKSGGGERQQQPTHVGAAKSPAKLPAIKHVFLIVLDDAAYAEVFGPESKSRYLARTLEGKGELLVRYYAIAHQQLPDGIALISGQGPTEATASDCAAYAEIAPAGSAAQEQITGEGCVYPSSVKTIASQLTAKRLTWRAYVEGIGDGGSEASSGCYHPPLGAADPTAAFGLPGAVAPEGGIVSATFRDPFVYFRSVTDSRSCAAEVVGIERLHRDLANEAHTPNLSYIVPGLCDDGSTKPCAPGSPAGMVAADGFLRKVVAEILASKAYKQNGMIAITVDEAPTTGEYADSSSCCSQPSFPDVHSSAPAGAGGGGGEVGALLLSPFVKGGKISEEPYDHFSMLRTIEDLFGLPHLGYAALRGMGSLSPSLFSRRAG